MCKQLLGLILLLVFAGVAEGQPKATTDASATAASKAETQDQAFALLGDAAREMRELRVSEYRLRWQMQLAGLIWRHDEKQARAMFAQAAADWNTLWGKVAETEIDEPDGEPSYNTYQQLRQEMARAWAQFDGVAALGFVRDTRPLLEPYLGDANSREQEAALLTDIAAEVARKDPKEALKLAQESLNQGIQQQQISLLQRLKELHRPSANQFAQQLYEKLKQTDLLKSNGANYVANSLLQYAHEALGSDSPPLSEREIRAYVAQLSKLALSVSPDKFSPNGYTPEVANAQALVGFLSAWSELEKYAPGRGAELKARVEAWQRAFNRFNPWQEYYDCIQQKSVPEALEKLATAPLELQDNLYLQIANKLTNEGNYEQARQIISEHVKNAGNRENGLRSLEQTQLTQAISKGDMTAARAGIARLRTRQERFQYHLQLAEQLSSQNKKDEALATLDEARQLLPPRPRAQGQLYFYFSLAQAYAQYDAKRSFDLLEPLLDQFNELCAAAERVDGFLGQTYHDGEFQPNGSLGEFAQQISFTLAVLAGKDFARARKCLTRLQRPEVRVAASLAIAQNFIGSDETGNALSSLPLNGLRASYAIDRIQRLRE